MLLQRSMAMFEASSATGESQLAPASSSTAHDIGAESEARAEERPQREGAILPRRATWQPLQIPS